MEKLIHRLWMLLVLAVAGVACDRDGISEDKLYLQREFVPVSHVQGLSYYGKVTFTWENPDSTSLLCYNEISWVTPSGEADRKVFHRHADSVVVGGLASGDYSFAVTSFSEKGESIAVASLDFSVLDWTFEPPVLVENLVVNPAENTLFLSWTHPVHPTYERAVFEVYQGGALAGSATVGIDDAPECSIVLDYETDYQLKYYSVSRYDIASTETATESFTTGRWVPVPPDIVVDRSRIDAAHSADITWVSPGADAKEMRITYTDLRGSKRTYTFDAKAEKGWLGLLPGGKTMLTVEVSNSYGDWSIARQKEINTLAVAGRYQFRSGNGVATGSRLARTTYTYIGKGTAAQYDANPAAVYFTFSELDGFNGTSNGFYYFQDSGSSEIHSSMDELELFVNCTRVVFGIINSASPLTIDDYKQAIDRMFSLNTVWLSRSFRYMEELQEYILENYPNISVSLYG